jgi:hypothetical protein
MFELRFSSFLFAILLTALPCFGQLPSKSPNQPTIFARQKIFVPSTLDGSQQPSYLTLPTTAEKRNTNPSSTAALVPMVVSLHSCSADLEQRVPELEKLIEERQWFCLQPNFRGIIDHPEALGSTAAIQDIIDAVDWYTSFA